MIPWKEIDRVPVPGHDGDIVLRQRDTEFSIRTEETELMNSRQHGSEHALAEFTLNQLQGKSHLRILIGGLGMGFTLAAALTQADSKAKIVVSELIPEVIQWNQTYFGDFTGYPLADPRVTIKTEDVARTIRSKKSFWDAILLDVDNGPQALTRKTNDRLYSITGLKHSCAALRPGGILSVWSSTPDKDFTRRLKQCGFLPDTKTVRSRKPGKGSLHTIWFAKKKQLTLKIT